MSYTSNPYEAHLQLGILFLDKEDLTKAKMHFKNCLYFKENDILILAHLTVILVSEGKMHEAKFFLSRILVALEARVEKVTYSNPPSVWLFSLSVVIIPPHAEGKKCHNGQDRR